MTAMTGYRAAVRGFAFAACALALSAGGLKAQELTAAQKSAMKANCRSDFIAHCMSTSPGSKEALQCLQNNLAGLSAGCKKAVASTMPKAEPPPPPKAATAPPPAAPPPPKAATAPPPKAPPPPKAASAPPPKANAMEAIKTHCRSDYMAKCASIPPGGQEALQCLQRHVGSVSPACQTAVRATLPKRTPAAAKPAQPTKPKAAARTAPAAPMQIDPPAQAATPPQPDLAMLEAKAAHLPLPKRLMVFRACNQDQAVVCPRIRPGDGRIVVCLVQNADALSAFCKRTLMGALQ